MILVTIITGLEIVPVHHAIGVTIREEEIRAVVVVEIEGEKWEENDDKILVIINIL